jgi:alpha-glucuronidase
MYYSRDDANGIGFDRTATGTDTIAQYAPEGAGLSSAIRRSGFVQLSFMTGQKRTPCVGFYGNP